MALRNFGGFETGDLVDAAATSGSGFSVSSSIKRTGGYALRLNAVGGASPGVRFNGLGADGKGVDMALTATTVYLTCYVYIATLPPSGTHTLLDLGSSALQVAQVRISSAGVVTGVGSTTSSNVATLSTGQWYRIDLRALKNGTCGLAIDGGTEQTFTGNNNNIDGVFFGTRGTSVVYDAYFDDWVMDDAAFFTKPEVRIAVPIGAGNYSAWPNGTGTTFAEVDEIPHDSGTTHIRNSTSAQAHTFDMQTAATLGVTGAISAVKALAVVGETSSTTTLCSVRLRSGSTDSDTTAVDVGTTAYVPLSKILELDPSTSAAWTIAGFNAAEAGVVIGADTSPVNCTAVYLMVLGPAGEYGTAAAALKHLTASGSGEQKQTGTAAAALKHLTAAGSGPGRVTFPRIESVTLSAEAAGGSADRDVDLPATVVAGELLLISFMNDASQTVQTPADWALLGTQAFSTGRLSIFAKVADGSEGGTSVTFTLDGVGGAAAQCFRIRIWSGSLADISVGTFGTATGTSLNLGSVSAAWGSADNLFLVLMGMLGTAAATSGRTMANYNDPTTNSVDDTTAIISTYSWRRELTAAADNPPANQSFGSTQSIIGVSVVIKPADWDNGQVAAVLPRLALSAGGSVPETGTAAATLARLALSAEGTFVDPNVMAGPAAVTLPALTAAASGATNPEGAAVATLPAMTAALAGDQEQSGEGAATLPALAASAAGAMEPAGELAASLAALTASAAGTLEPEGELAASLAGLSASATGTMAPKGELAAALPMLVANVVAEAQEDVDGDAAAQLPRLSASASGLMPAEGSGGATLPVLAAAASGGQEQSGDSAASLPAMTAAATGGQTQSGTASASLPALAAAASGGQEQTATGAATLSGLEAAASGGMGPAGTAAATLPMLLAEGDGDAPPSGSGAATLPALRAAAGGELSPGGSVADTLPHLGLYGLGVLEPEATIAVSLRALRVYALGIEQDQPVGAGDVVLPFLRAASSGAMNPDGELAVSLRALFTASSGLMLPSGSGSPSLAPLRAAGDVLEIYEATAAAFLPLLRAFALGGQPITAEVAVTLAMLVASLDGTWQLTATRKFAVWSPRLTMTGRW